MRSLPFKIPKIENSSLYLQVDDEAYFYDQLHQHPELQLTWIVKGEGTLIYGDYLGQFKAGDIYLFGSNMPHVFRSSSVYYQPGSSGVLSRTIFFRPEFIKDGALVFPELESLTDFLQQSDRGLKISSTTSEVITDWFQEVFQSTSIARLGKFFGLLNQLMDTHYEWLSFQPQKSINESQGRRLDDVFQFTLDHYQKPIRLDEVADIVHMNKAAFCRYFKQHTRKTYLNFLNEIRMQKAVELLRNSELSIAQVAYEVGFNNLSNFNRTYKLLRAKTPMQERMSFRVELQ
ncbi:AraC family transcriptional regulator [Roseivirga sp.]|uniref:AraC family transcriptional regulator n=1 Tax=Roseivirga sp. TaxID=1964215 RepID=UPI003B530471